MKLPLKFSVIAFQSPESDDNEFNMIVTGKFHNPDFAPSWASEFRASKNHRNSRQGKAYPIELPPRKVILVCCFSPPWNHGGAY